MLKNRQHEKPNSQIYKKKNLPNQNFIQIRHNGSYK